MQVSPKTALPAPMVPAKVRVQVPQKMGFSALLAPRKAMPKGGEKAHPQSPEKPVHERKHSGHSDHEGDRKRPYPELDPDLRHAAALAPPIFAAPVAPMTEAAPAARAHVSLEDLVPALVKKIAWAGDGRRGSARIEIGAGELAGATLIVHADEGKVRVELSVPAGVDTEQWRDRLEKRLGARGLDVESVKVS